MTLANAAYTGLATYGRVQAVLGFVVGLVVGIALIGGGLWLALFHKTTHTAPALARVLEAKCRTDTKPVACDIVGSYELAGVAREASFTTYDKVRSKDDTVDIWYDPNDPSDVVAGTDSRWFGWILAAVGLLVVAISGFSMYMSIKYKAVAAIGGGVSLVDSLMD